MRYVYPAAATGVVLAFFIMGGYGVSSSPSITNYQLVSEQRITRTEWYYTYRADLVNPGQGRASMTASVKSLVPGAKVVPGQGVLHFAPVPSNGTVTSSDTFTLMVDRNLPFTMADLAWTFLSPTANAGPNQTAPVGGTVLLNGGGSADPGLAGPLSFEWSFKSRPAASAAVLLNPTSVMPSFVLDLPGRYVVGLTVRNGAGNDSSQVVISTVNSPPVANAGPNQTAAVGANLTLNGSSSSDVDGDPLTYRWTLITRPDGSSATLQNTLAVVTSFTADKAGTYVAQLVVNDGNVDSAASTMRVTTQNAAPVANAGVNQVSVVGSIIQLNGAGSTDIDGDPLTYNWSLITKPAGSSAALSSAFNVNPTFTADAAGTYVAQLVVNDGKVDSTPATTSITTSTIQAPTANAGPNQTVVHGATVDLSGKGTDPQGKPLTYIWSLITRPPGSVAVLSSTSVSGPSFLSDRPGTYVAQLIVSNGTLNSAPSSVTITTTNSPPVAVAGPGQIAVVGTTVTLNGTASSDADSDPLTFAWSLMSRPPSSAAVVVSPLSPTPTLTVDAAGTYVVQLIVNDGFANSSPVTTTITVNTMALQLTPNPLNLSGAPKLLRVALGSPAGPGGQEVTLQGFDPAIIAVLSKVVVPEGGTGIDVTVTPVAGGSTLILATSAGFQAASATVNVTVPTITVSLDFSVVGLSRTIRGTVTLSTAAPAAGTRVLLSTAPGGIVALDTSAVTIAAGNTTATFDVTGLSEGTATITGSSSGYIAGTASVLSTMIGVITMPTPISLAPGQTGGLDVKLATAAPAGGALIQLVSSNVDKVTVDPQVFIAEGKLVPVTMPQVNAIAFGSAIITASAPGFLGANQTVKVGGALSFSSPTITVGAGGTQNVTLLLTAPAPAVGLTVNLNSSNQSVATVPPQVIIPPNQDRVTFDVNGIAAGNSILTTSTAVPSLANATAAISVTVSGAINLSPNVAVELGGTAPLLVTLSTPAPAGGAVVQLITSDSTKVGLSSTTVNVGAGNTQPDVQPHVTGSNLGQATITATAAGYGSSSTQVKTTAKLSFTQTSTTLTGPETKNVTLTLSGNAPTGGLAVSLSASPAGLVTIPSGVVIAQGTTSTTVAVTGVVPGTVTITASTAVPNVTSANTSVTVQGAGSVILQSGVTVAPGQTVEFDVALPAPADSAVTVDLTSGDLTKVTVTPASVTIAAGLTTPAQKPKATGVAFGSAVISAASAGYSTASQSFTVGATMAFTPQPLVISGTATQNLTLTLSANAPTGGVPVNLSVTPAGIVTIPPTVTIPAGSATVTVPVTGATIGSATITASTSAPNVPDATASITVQNAGTIGLQQDVTVGLGQSTEMAVSLSVAGATDTVVGLLSSDPTKLTVSPASVTIPAGQKQPASQPQVTGKSLGTATVNASAPFYSPASRSVQITGSISFSPQNLTITGTETQNLTLTLSGPAPTGGLSINVSSSNTGVATVSSALVTIPETLTTVTVPVKGVSPGSVVVTASSPNLANATAGVTVKAAADIIMAATLTVAPEQQAVFPISLAKTQPTDVWVSLTSSDPTIAAPSAAQFKILAGNLQPVGSIKVNGYKAGTVTMTATSVGLVTATTTVNVQFTLTLTPATLVLTGTGTQKFLTLALSGPAPVGGIAVTLSSSDTGVATVPLQPAVIQANTTSLSVPVKSVGAGVTVIRATAAGIPEVTSEVTVVPSGGITLSANASYAIGQIAPITVTLSSPAPAGGVTVNLTTSDPSKLSISASQIVIAEGGLTSSAFMATAVNVGAATLNATATNYSPSNSLAIQVTATLIWNTPSITIAGIGKVGQLILDLPVPLQFQVGVPVVLSSSNPSVVTVQPGIIIWSDGSTQGRVLIQVNSAGVGTALIRASGVNIPEVTATVTVVGPPSITTTSLPDGAINVNYGGAMTATGGVSPLTWSAIGLPGNVQMNAAGQFSGKPTSAGSSSVVFTVSDASNPPFTATTTLTLKVSATPPPASITAVEGSNQTATISTPFTTPLKVSVKDANNNPVSGATVTFTTPGSGAGGTFAGGNSAVTDASGVAVASQFNANATAGAYLVTASVSGGSPSTTFSLTNTVGSPASITVHGGTPQTAPINTAFPTALQAIVKDAGGNALSGVTVTFGMPGSGASGSFTGGTTAVTNGAGIAAKVFTANSTAGPYSVTASAPGVATQASFSLTNSAGAAASVTATDGTPQSAPINTAFAKSLKVVVKDAGGNLVNGATVSFTVPGSGASGVFGGGNTAVSDASGVAVSSQFSANGTAGAYTVTAGSGSATTAPFALTNLAGTPTSISIEDGTIQNAPINTAFGKVLKVKVKDAGNNGIGGVTVTFTLPTSGAGGTFAGSNTVQTDPSGFASSPVLTANSTAGSFTVSASISGVAPVVFQLTSTGGSAASIAYSDGSSQSAPINTEFGKRLKAVVKDAGNNPVSGVTVTFAVPPGGPSSATGSFTGGANTALTDANGVATSVIFRANGTVGTYTVTATAPSVPGSVSFSLTNTAGPPASMTVVDGSGESARINTAFTKQLKALVKDAGGNLVVGAPITFTVPSSGASGAFAGGINIVNTDPAGIVTSPVFSANGNVGPYTVTASAAGGSPSVGFALTNTPGPAALMTALSGSPQSATVNTQFTNPLKVTVTDASNHPVSNVVVTFAPPAGGAGGAFTGIVTGVTDASGVATSTPFKANTASGTYNVTATVTGLTPVNFQLTNLAGPASSIAGAGGTGQNATTNTPFALPLKALVTDAFGNPVPLATVTFAAPQSGPSGTFASGTVNYQTNPQGIATSNTFTANGSAGGYNVSATTAGLPGSATFALANTTPTGSGIITMANPTIGKDLQAPVLIQFTPPIAATTDLTVTSSDGTRVLLGAAGALGDVSVTGPVSAGVSNVTTYVKALANSGTATLTVSIAGYATKTATVTLAPSGFVLSGSQGIGGNFTTFQGVKTMLTVFAARLDPVLFNFVESQELRGSFAINVQVTATPSNLGAMSPTSVAFTGGMSSGTTQFTASTVVTGPTTLRAVPPGTFTAPGTGASLTATVAQSGITPFSATIGKNLQVPVTVSLTGLPSTDVEVRVLSDDSSKLKFSTAENAAGLAEVTMTLPANRNTTQVFYAQGFADNGTVGYRVDVTGYGSVNGTVTLAPSGFALRSINGIGNGFMVVAGTGSPTVKIVPGLITNGGAAFQQQALAGGPAANVSVTVANPALGTMNPSTVVVTGGSFEGATLFQPTGPSGSTTITANPPAGYIAPASGSIGVVIQAAVMFISDDMTVGHKLQLAGEVFRTVAAPSDLLVTLTSSDASLVTFSATPTGAGAGTVIITIPANQLSAPYYVQGAAPAGVATYTASATGFPVQSSTVTLAPSGVIMTGSTINLFLSPMPIQISTAMLDPTSRVWMEKQMLAGGYPAMVVDLGNSNPASATIATPVTIQPGQTSVNSMFTPLLESTSTTINIVNQPLGGPTPSNATSLNITVL